MNSTIEKQIKNITLGKLKDRKQISQFITANNEFKKLVQEGVAKHRGNQVESPAIITNSDMLFNINN